jgi:aldose 1-epimerase
VVEFSLRLCPLCGSYNILKMWSSKLLLVPLLASIICAHDCNGTISGRPEAYGKYMISAPGTRALFVPCGASISNLFINDSQGIECDIVMGFDNASYYSIDRQHPHLGGGPGRYANRIKNSSFVLDRVTYNILPNENTTAANPQGVDTLHGGPDGWDWRNFTVVSHTDSSIIFSIVDSDGMEGFPGEVVSYITYTLSNMTWAIKMVALATTKKTPIMLSSHVSRVPHEQEKAESLIGVRPIGISTASKTT